MLALSATSGHSWPGDARHWSAVPRRLRINAIPVADSSHFTMMFDTSPVVLKRINETLRRDPMVVRWMLTKKGAAV